MNDKLFKRLKKRETWLKIYTISGKEHTGQIEKILKTYLILVYYWADKKMTMKIIIKKSQIDAIECMECENSTVWSNKGA